VYIYSAWFIYLWYGGGGGGKGGGGWGKFSGGGKQLQFGTCLVQTCENMCLYIVTATMVTVKTHGKFCN
jgi:hypothetical protein